MSDDTEQKLREAVATLTSTVQSTRWMLGFVISILLLIASILVGMIPWAYQMHGRTVAIETSVANLDVLPAWFQRDVERNAEQIMELQARLLRIEQQRDVDKDK